MTHDFKPLACFLGHILPIYYLLLLQISLRAPGLNARADYFPARGLLASAINLSLCPGTSGHRLQPGARPVHPTAGSRLLGCGPSRFASSSTISLWSWVMKITFSTYRAAAADSLKHCHAFDAA
jgi:hypothetical protein